jgi:hypothetical protein
MKAVQEDDRVALGREVPILPGRKQRPEPGDDPRHGALRQVPLAEQWFQRRANPPAIHAAEIAAENRLVDLAGPAGVAWQQLAVEFLRGSVAAHDTATRHRDRPRPVRRRDRALHDALAIATAPIGALVPIGGQRRRELLPQRDLQRFSDFLPELCFDVLTKLQNGGGACASLLHGVILRRRCERRSG